MKKKFAILLVLVLALSVCAFSLAACDEEENRIKPEDLDMYKEARADRYLTTFDYWYTVGELEIVGADTGSITIGSDELDSADAILNYDGESGSVLAMQKFLQVVGSQVTIAQDSITFTGSLGRMESEILPRSLSGSYLHLKPTTQQKEEIIFDLKESSLLKLQCDGPTSSDADRNNVLVFFEYTTIIQDVEYRLTVTYLGHYELGDEYSGEFDGWSD